VRIAGAGVGETPTAELESGRHILRVFGRSVSAEVLQTSCKFLVAVALTLGACMAVRHALADQIAKDRAAIFIRAATHGFSDRAFAQLMMGAEPGVIRFAVDHNPDGPQKAWERPPGWKRLDIETVPTLGFSHLSMADAQRINGVIPNSGFANPPMTPFVLHASAPERQKAVGCMTAAIYYEGALEPREGQEAVAQVVINRLRHAGFPKSVCGVVFQGSEQPGCQFSFACDGSMAREPVAWAWNNAKQVAERALSGHVMADVGAATHYHTDWIIAPWTPTLIKVGRFGSQIFFRPTGPEGEPAAFLGRYLGGEAKASRLDLIGKPAAAQTPALIAASTPGSVAAPMSIVRGGRVIMLPPGALALGRIHSVIGDPNGAQGPQQASMHAMIALRAAAAKAAMGQPGQSAAPPQQVQVLAQQSLPPQAQPGAGARQPNGAGVSVLHDRVGSRPIPTIQGLPGSTGSGLDGSNSFGH
jgi:spore germination cell wall hydrolase CwlJ-like protein